MILNLEQYMRLILDNVDNLLMRCEEETEFYTIFTFTFYLTIL